MKNDFIYPQPQQIGGEMCPVGGLTKLEYFAGLAMQAIISNNISIIYATNAEFSVQIAKSLIAELDRVQAEKGE